MKNKHLVLLFLCVLSLGLIARWLPFKYRSDFNNDLLQVDTLQLDNIRITAPDQPELVLEKVGTGWIAEQSGRTYPVEPAEIQAMFRLLAGVQTYQSIHSRRPDTLGMDSAKVLHLVLNHRNGAVEKLDIGAETQTKAGAVSYLRLPNHDGIYKAPGRFRSVFFKKLNDFRSKNVLRFDPTSVQKIGISPRKTAPVYLNKVENWKPWTSANQAYSVSADSVMEWLKLFEQLSGCDFADNFDETREQETLYSTITLGLISGQYFTLRIFYQRPADLPEDLSRLRKETIRTLPSYVLQSSQNPRNYFSLPDTVLAIRLCKSLLPVEADTLNAAQIQNNQ